MDLVGSIVCVPFTPRLLYYARVGAIAEALRLGRWWQMVRGPPRMMSGLGTVSQGHELMERRPFGSSPKDVAASPGHKVIFEPEELGR